MNEIINVQGVECYEENGIVYLKLEAVARGLGFTQTQKKKGVEYTSIRWERINKYLTEFGFPQNWGKDDFISESVFYRLAMRANSETADKFQSKIANEILPTIRKHGAYMTPEKLEEVLLNPDTLIQLAQNLKLEQEARKKAEKELAFKNDVIQGLVDDIPLADKRRRISQIIRKGCLDPHVLGIRWNMLYNEFEMKHHMNLDKRMQSDAKIKTKIEFIDKKLNMIPELYDVCCKLYTGEYKKLMKELECATN